MKAQRNFVATVKEPAGGFAVELEFHEEIAGITNDTVMIYLKDGSTIEDAENLKSVLNNYGAKVATSG